MKPSNRLFGIIAMFYAPFLWLEFYFDNQPHAKGTSVSAVCDLIYMTGWIFSIIGLYRLHRESKRVKRIITIQLTLLTIANIYNIWGIIQPGTDNLLHDSLDASWPLSNLCMLVLGVAVVKAAVLQGWKRYIVLIVGLWLPVGMTVMLLFGQAQPVTIAISGAYSTLAWFCLGAMIYKSNKQYRRSMLSIPASSCQDTLLFREYTK